MTSISKHAESLVDHGAMPAQRRRRDPATVLLGVWFFAVLFFLFAPLFVVVIFSFNSSEISTLPFEGFSLRWYQDMIQNQDLHEALLNSLIVAFFTVIVAVALGVLSAYGIYRYASRYRTAMNSVSTTPVMVPRLILGIMMLTYFNLLQVNLSLVTVVISHVVMTYPYVVLIVSARLVGFDPALEEAARDLGASTFTVFWQIILPLLRPAIIGGALLSFTLSFDEVVVTFFTTGTENTLPMMIWSMLRFGLTPEINAIATFTILVSGIVALMAEVMIRRAQGVNGK